MYKYTRILPPLAFLMLLFGYGCKKEFTATFVGSYHVVGTITAPGQASQHIDRNDNIQSDGANILLYQGTDYYFDSSASDNTHYQFDVMSGSYNGFLSFPKPFNDSMYFQSWQCPDPVSCTYTNLQGKKIP